ncbi:hypothetical protein AZE42_11236 [Rhizopogon vesiculosus]|uniref:Uncharacterized protein n=1 Tax=Rhizopogon vesiculosus TaxID=180088 RepID=A0A1J8QDJ6_9AGAM|nr:hypothetical protein AZE42_11236 [Rhizopogon vesiculosus]
MWPIFEFTHDPFKSDAIDFLDEILPSPDNFVSYGTDVLKARPDDRQKQLQDIIAIAADHIDKSETSTFLLANLEILINTVLLNASAALHFMDRGFSEDVWHAAYLEILAKGVSADNPTAYADISREPV